MQRMTKMLCCMQPTEVARNRRKYRLRSQVAIIAVASLVALNHGMSISHAAVLVPQIRAENGTLCLDQDDATWIASLYNFASPLGALIGGFLSEFFGRRCSLMIALGGMTTGWISIFLSQNSGSIMAGRCLEGVFKTIAATSITVLIDETVHPICRGFIFPQYGTTLSLGIFVMMGLATLMSWRASSLVAAGVSAVTFVSVFLVPETPTWFVRKGHLAKAEKALHRIWGPSRHQQASETLQDLRERFGAAERTPPTSCTITSSCNKLLKPNFLKPFLIMHLINVFIQLFCGNHLVVNYGVDMVSHMAENHDPYVINTILALIRVVALFIVGLTMNTVGRRGYMMISGIGSTISAIALAGVLFPHLGGRATTEVREILSIILLTTYVVSFCSGYYCVPPMMIGETQPAAMRGYLCGYIYTMNDFSAGGAIKMYPWLLDTLGFHGMFLLFGVSCAVCAVISYLFLPETNGKTLEEIEDYFKQKNIMWVTRDKSSTERSAEERLMHRGTDFQGDE